MDVLTISRITAISFEIVAFAAACSTFKYHNAAFRILLYLLFYIVITESICMYIDLFCSGELQKKTVIGSNIYIVVESLFIYWYGLTITKSKIFRRVISATTGIFFLYWALNVYFNGVYVYPTAPVLLFSTNGLVIFLGLIIQQSDSVGFFKSPLFFLSLGMIIFYGCIMPYTSVVSYFAKMDNATLKKLAQILFISNYIRYSLITIAYIVLYRQEKAKK